MPWLSTLIALNNFHVELSRRQKCPMSLLVTAIAKACTCAIKVRKLDQVCEMLLRDFFSGAKVDIRQYDRAVPVKCDFLRTNSR